MASDKNWAKEYILDPLNAPEPSQETGPGTHFGNTLANNPKHTSSYPTPPVSAGNGTPTSIGSDNPFRRSMEASQKSPAVRARAISDASGNRLQKSPPVATRASRSPRVSGDYRSDAFASHGGDRSRSTGHSRNVSNASSQSGTRSRGDSLNQRPLEFSREEAKLASRSPHLKKKHLPGADSIDRLDVFSYHHEGPFDAALLARNTSFTSSPIAALETTNREAIKATPRENIIDSVQRHRPLDGTAIVAPGESDRFGRRYEYEEGDNMMIFNGANYKRWPGVDYLPEDIKGKGEPSFSIERALKQHKAQAKANRLSGEIDPADAQTSGIEMSGGPVELVGVGRSGSKRHGLEGLKKRIGSLRKKDRTSGTAAA